ncbi:MAG: hypothetical protein ACJ749_07415 [Flavisolibacter sp.]|jgi:hypothetical protein
MDLHISYPLFFIIAIVAAAIYFFNEWRKKTKQNNEAEFLDELVKSYNYWMDKGEKEYAEAYKVLINKFTQIPDEE